MRQQPQWDPQLLQRPTQPFLQDALKCLNPKTISMVTALNSGRLFREMLMKPQMPLQMPLVAQCVTAPGQSLWTLWQSTLEQCGRDREGTGQLRTAQSHHLAAWQTPPRRSRTRTLETGR